MMRVPHDSEHGENSRPTDRSTAADEAERRKRSGQSAAAARIENQQSWVDQQIRVAMARGDFDDLEGAGKPIKDLGQTHDPDWWLKRLIDREQISVLPPALQLRKDDAELDARLDTTVVEADVRRELADFNARVMKARYDPLPGPPLITQPRDVDAEILAWRARRLERRERRRIESNADPGSAGTSRRPRRWWPGRRR